MRRKHPKTTLLDTSFENSEIHLTHACIQRHHDPFATGSLRHRFQSSNTKQRESTGDCEALRNTASHTQTGERTGAGAEGNPIEIGKTKPLRAQQRVGYRQKRCRIRGAFRTSRPVNNAIDP